MKRKEIILILVLLIILIIAIILQNKSRNTEKNTETIETKEEFSQTMNEETKLNISTKLNETKYLDEYKIENIQLTNKDGQTILLADVTNTTDKDTKATLVDIMLFDKEGKELKKIGGVIAPLKAKESTKFNSNVSGDYTNAYDFIITKTNKN